MAKRRMISKDIIRNDAYTSMSPQAQALYPQLVLDADDDGFVPTARGITAMLGFSPDALEELVATRYLLYDETDKVYIVKHWGMFQQIRSDRYTPTTYVEAKARLKLDEKGSYIEYTKEGKPLPKRKVTTKRQPNGNQMATNGCHSIVKNSLVKNYKGRSYTEEELNGLYKNLEDNENV